jgi:hypothetical protein
MTVLSYSESIRIATSPEALYGMVSDVTRIGEWSPICTACWWDEGDGPAAGAWFTGHNETPERTWETRSQVLCAEPGREFAWTVAGGWVRWGFTMSSEGDGAILTESWRFLDAGINGFHERYGADAEAQIAERTQAAHRGIPLTLAAIKRTAEAC